MIDAAIFPSLRYQTRMASSGVHHPNLRHVTGGGTTENNPLAVGRFARAKVPDGRIGTRQARDRVVARVEPADFRATPRQVRLVIPVEMIGIGPFGLEFPGHFRAGQPTRIQDRTIMRPGDDVRPATTVLQTAVGGAEPHDTALRQHALLRSIGAAQTHVRPIMARIRARPAVLEGQPISVWRPDRAEVEMAGLGSDLDSLATAHVARPNLVAGGTREVICHTPLVRAET